jgi:hypothetical protein
MTEQSFTRQPRVDPNGWVSLRRAFFWFGRSAIGHEFGAATFLMQDVEGAIAQKSYAHHGSLPLNAAGDHELSLDSPTGARLFTPPVCRSFLSAVRNGRLRTGYASKGAGEVLPMPHGAWRTDDDYVCFAGWSFDPNDLGSAGKNSPSWVFVHSADLTDILQELKDWREALPEWDGESEPDPEVTYRNRWPMCFRLIDDDLWVEPPILPEFNVAKLESVSDTYSWESSVAGQVRSKNPDGIPMVKAVSNAEMEAWIDKMIDQGLTLTRTAQIFRTAFPGRRIVHNRDKIRDLYSKRHFDKKGYAPKSGPRAPN